MRSFSRLLLAKNSFVFLLTLSTSLQTLCAAPLTPLSNYEERLAHLESQIEKEIHLLGYPHRQWVPEKKHSHGDKIYDVVIIGGGQTGLTIAFALQREKIDNVIVFDENEEGLEGPWMKYAYMRTLRSEKNTLGPDCNIPSLTCQSWFETKYGASAWERLEKIPRTAWADYLHWVEKSLKLPVSHRTQVGALEWDKAENCFMVPLVKDGESTKVYARKVVLATGHQGSGEWIVPDVVKHLPNTHYTSVYERVDFKALAGKKVGILGGGACAFDAATMCHAHGAEEIHLFFRRHNIPNVHAFGWAEYGGFLNHFGDLPDEYKWKFITKICEMGQPPTAESVHHVRSLPNVFMHFCSPWLKTAPLAEQSIVETPFDRYTFDHLLTAIGWSVDLTLRKELTHIYPEIALWADRFAPEEEDSCTCLLNMPYLGKYFEFQEKDPGSAPYLSSLFNCTGGAFLSKGINPSIAIMGTKYSVQKLVYGITQGLFVEDKEYHYDTLNQYNDISFENE